MEKAPTRRELVRHLADRWLSEHHAHARRRHEYQCLRDECLNEHWFVSQAHAKAMIEVWRREYNEERPKKTLGGLTPSAYTRQLAGKSVTATPDSKLTRYR